jgi:hypothetical protein
VVAHLEHAVQGRQHHDRKAAAERHERDGIRHLLLVRVADTADGGDRGDTADREARCDEERQPGRDAEPLPRPAGSEEGRDDHGDDDEQPA